MSSKKYVCECGCGKEMWAEEIWDVNEPRAGYGTIVLNDKCYYYKPHRYDGPAIISRYKDGVCYEWYIHGSKHNESGPALIFKSDDKIEYYFYLDGECFTEEEWLGRLSPGKRIYALYQIGSWNYDES